MLLYKRRQVRSDRIFPTCMFQNTGVWGISPTSCNSACGGRFALLAHNKLAPKSTRYFTLLSGSCLSCNRGNRFYDALLELLRSYVQTVNRPQCSVRFIQIEISISPYIRATIQTKLAMSPRRSANEALLWRAAHEQEKNIFIANRLLGRSYTCSSYCSSFFIKNNFEHRLF